MKSNSLASEIDERLSNCQVSIGALIGQEFHVNLNYCLGTKPRLVAVDGDMALLQFPNGVWLKNVPVSELQNASGMCAQLERA